MGSSPDKYQTDKSWTTFANVVGYLFIVCGFGMIIFRHFLCDHFIGIVATLLSMNANLNMGPEGFSLSIAGAGVLLSILGLAILLRRKRPFCFIRDFVIDFVLHE
ncbi:MAG: hypothetical protein ABIK52_08020, partial [Bacteroidota bacterium]